MVIGLLLPSPAPLPDTTAAAAAGLLAPPSPAPLPDTTAAAAAAAAGLLAPPSPAPLPATSAAAAAGLLAPVWLGVVPGIRTLAVLGMTGGSTEAIRACFKTGPPLTAANLDTVAAAAAFPDGGGPLLPIAGGAAATPAGALACPSCASWVCMACCDAVSFL